MRTKLLPLILVLCLAVAGGASPAAAKSCAKRCKKAIKCAQKSCAQYHGPIKAGCKKGWKITFVGQCKAQPQSNLCEQAAIEFAANGCP